MTEEEMYEERRQERIFDQKMAEKEQENERAAEVLPVKGKEEPREKIVEYCVEVMEAEMRRLSENEISLQERITRLEELYRSALDVGERRRLELEAEKKFNDALRRAIIRILFQS